MGIKCPSCGSDSLLYRIECLPAYALLQAEDSPAGGWEYAGESELDWDNQDREWAPEGTPEFVCRKCDTAFDYSQQQEAPPVEEEVRTEELKLPIRKRKLRIPRKECNHE